LFTDDNDLAKLIINSGNISGENVWRLPLGEIYKKQIESSVADMKNLGIANAGENAAAAEFLKNFVFDTKWAHLDIAGVAWNNEEESSFAQKGVTGYGVRLLEQLVHLICIPQ
jgi:leucyl aminopeptidase